MDIRAYFNKLREIELSISPDYVVLVSNNTPDGGKSGRLVEVSRTIAARMVLAGAARLASEIEAREFREQVVRDVEQAKADLEASRLRVTFSNDKVAVAQPKPVSKPRG